MRIILGYRMACFTLLSASCVCLLGAQQVDKTDTKKKVEVTSPAPPPVTLSDLDLKKDDMTKAAGAAVDPGSYVIGAEDIIAIRVWREPEMSALYSVRPDGKIS